MKQSMNKQYKTITGQLHLNYISKPDSTHRITSFTAVAYPSIHSHFPILDYFMIQSNDQKNGCDTKKQEKIKDWFTHLMYPSDLEKRMPIIADKCQLSTR